MLKLEAILSTVFLAVLAGVCALFLAVAPARAQAQCGPRAAIVEWLAGTYGEQVHFIGLGGNGAIHEVFLTDDGPSWTILETRPDGVSCIRAAGLNFQRLEPTDMPEGSPV